MATSQVNLGERIFQSMPKVNSELFSLAYGAIVVQVLRDCEDDVKKANMVLEKMGYNIGVRLVDEYFAKTHRNKCKEFVETAEGVAKVGFKIFLGLSTKLEVPQENVRDYTISWGDYSLIDFVEIPQSSTGLHYGNIICGAIRGALEVVGFTTEVSFTKDMLIDGGDINEIKVVLKEAHL